MPKCIEMKGEIEIDNYSQRFQYSSLRTDSSRLQNISKDITLCRLHDYQCGKP